MAVNPRKKERERSNDPLKQGLGAGLGATFSVSHVFRPCTHLISQRRGSTRLFSSGGSVPTEVAHTVEEEEEGWSSS